MATDFVRYNNRNVYIDGTISRIDGNGFVKATDNGCGYLLADKEYVHRWVWKAFVGEIPLGFVIDHIDNNKKNNHLSNLQLLSRTDNLRKAHLRMTKDKVDEIFYLKSLGYTQKQIGNKMNITQQSISRILSGKQHKL